MAPSNFKSSVSVTHIGTATALLNIDGAIFLTDPAFDPAGSEYPIPGVDIVLKNEVGPAIAVDKLPPIDAILLSHEDHPDNLDAAGRKMLGNHQIFTTDDGAKNLNHLPNVSGLNPWERIDAVIGGTPFKITATPCKHVPGNECVGFILETEAFGIHQESGLPNAVWFAGDTVNFPELNKIREKWHVVVAILNLGSAHAPTPDGPMQITMGGRDGADLCRTLGVHHIVPIHYDGWGHFTEHGNDLAMAFDEVQITDKITWLKAGEAVRVV
jgi:L-ascorbate metabolism protein UlaG (beta-lactamase superfamily)